MRTKRSPLRTLAPSGNGISMISPAASVEIFTSTSGWTLPLAVTICVIVFTNASSVVTATGLVSPLERK